MRKVMVVLIGLMVVSGLLLGPRPSEAVDTCFASGVYDLDGFVEPNIAVQGFITFVTPGTCTASGTWTSSATLRVDGGPPIVVTPSGTYIINADTTATITATSGGTTTLAGLCSQVAGSVCNALHMAGIVASAGSFTMTKSSLSGVAGPSGPSGPTGASGPSGATGATGATGANVAAHFFGSCASPDVSASSYSSPGGPCTLGTPLPPHWVPVSASASGGVRNLRARVNPAPGAGGTWTFTVRKNHSLATSVLTCSITGAATDCTPDLTTNSLTTGTDKVTVQITPSGSPTAATSASWSFQFISAP